MLDHGENRPAWERETERVLAERERTNSRAPTRLYFHLENGDCEIPDRVGLELDDADDIRWQSLTALAEISRENPTLFEHGKGWRMNVVVESGERLFSLALDDFADRQRLT